MFGEESLLGQKTIKIDCKGRLLIPSKTKRQHGDVLVTLYDEDIKSYRIYNASTIEKILDDLKQKMLNATNEEDIRFYKKKSYELCKSILTKSMVDSQGRVLIGNIFDTNEVLVIGDYDNLIIKPKIKKK